MVTPNGGGALEVGGSERLLRELERDYFDWMGLTLDLGIKCISSFRWTIFRIEISY